MSSDPADGAAGAITVSEPLAVRRAMQADAPAIASLYRQVFVAKGSAPRPAAVWHWLYRESPQLSWSFVGVLADGSIVAHYGAIARRMLWNGRETVAALGLDTMAHPDLHRGLGRNRAFINTANAYFAAFGHPSRCSFTYGLPNPAALRIGRRLLGYALLHQPLPTLFHNLRDPRENDAYDVRPQAQRDVVPVARFDARADELWHSVARRLWLSTVRDSSYLNWRFADAPFKYRCLEVRAAGSLRALAVMRRRWCGVPILALVDYLGHDDDHASLDAVLRHAVGIAYRERLHRVELWLPPWSPLFAAALAAGFETENAPLSLCVRLHDPKLELAWVEQHWYYTIGDFDIF